MIRRVPYIHATSYINRIGIFVVATILINSLLGVPTTAISIVMADGIGDYFWWRSFDQ